MKIYGTDMEELNTFGITIETKKGNFYIEESDAGIHITTDKPLIVIERACNSLMLTVKEMADK